MRSTLFAAALLAVLPLTAAQGAGLGTPTGPVVLTVYGNLTHTNLAGAAQFDQAMIDALPQHTTITETPWYEGVQTFSGPLAQSILEAVGAEGTIVTVTALNDYSADIPFSDFFDSPVILASRLNDAKLSIRDKGPLFVMYPFDARPDLYNEVYFGRSVWQVTSITIH